MLGGGKCLFPFRVGSHHCESRDEGRGSAISKWTGMYEDWVDLKVKETVTGTMERGSQMHKEKCAIERNLMKDGHVNNAIHEPVLRNNEEYESRGECEVEVGFARSKRIHVKGPLAQAICQEEECLIHGHRNVLALFGHSEALDFNSSVPSFECNIVTGSAKGATRCMANSWCVSRGMEGPQHITSCGHTSGLLGEVQPSGSPRHVRPSVVVLHSFTTRTGCGHHAKAFGNLGIENHVTPVTDDASVNSPILSQVLAQRDIVSDSNMQCVWSQMLIDWGLVCKQGGCHSKKDYKRVTRGIAAKRPPYPSSYSQLFDVPIGLKDLAKAPVGQSSQGKYRLGGKDSNGFPSSKIKLKEAHYLWVVGKSIGVSNVVPEEVIVQSCTEEGTVSLSPNIIYSLGSSDNNMGCTVKNKNSRVNRKSRSVKVDSDSCCHSNKKWMVPYKYYAGMCPNIDSNPNVNSSSWVLCTESHLNNILLRNIDIIYNDTVSKLVALGHSEDDALKAVLHNGHCYGANDLATNVLHNSLSYLYRGNSDKHEFSDLKKLEEYSLDNLVTLLQEMRPDVNSRADAMWCLLMSNFHVLKASRIQLPDGNMCPPHLPDFESEEWKSGNKRSSVFPLNGFFCGTEMTLRLQRDIEFPKRLDLTPAMKCLLKRNVAMFADGYRANSKEVQSQVGEFTGISTVSKLDSSPVSETAILGEKPGHPPNPIDHNDLNSVLSKFLNLNIDDSVEFVAEDEKDEVIVTLVNQIRDLEKQVKERKDWAHEKAIQAARKLSSELIELKMFKMEREENQKMKKGKEVAEELEDPTMMRLAEMENSLRKASGQMDQATAAVRKLEAEKAEIKAELEASKLNASESVANCLQVAKREKKCLRKLLTWEKQRAKIQQDISDEKQKILEIQQELAQTKQCAIEAEVMRNEELKAKEEALALIEEERRSKEAAEASKKRNLKALSLKIEIDFQRRKDDLLRLEQEISHLKASTRPATLPTSECESEETEPQGETIAKLLQELDNVHDFSGKEADGSTDRECFICGKDEVSVIFLPCAHQVMCASCGIEYGRNGKAVCPCCRVPIEQRIHIFGAGS
ncbi:hypothetical protein VNO78_08001 [Psophocarpus tetragonolobus]|uniref:RING-type domain-containing protein n=1 Tax=Psophocarpus tetragonolobus TaxID=3891 RepID=A0AAN9T466_PSOTE